MSARDAFSENPPSISALFFGFLTLGLIGFGGVLPLARRMIVEERLWLTEQGFAELLGLCQFLPGGNISKLSVSIGLEFYGLVGGLASLLGLIAAPTLIVIALGVFHDQFQYNPILQHVFSGLAAAAVSLPVETALKILLPFRKKLLPVLIVVVCFVAIATLRLPLLPTMLVLAPVIIFLTWRMTA